MSLDREKAEAFVEGYGRTWQNWDPLQKGSVNKPCIDRRGEVRITVNTSDEVKKLRAAHAQPCCDGDVVI